MLQRSHHIHHRLYKQGIPLSGKWGSVLVVAGAITSLAGGMAYFSTGTAAEDQWVWLLIFGILMFYAVLVYPFFDKI